MSMDAVVGGKGVDKEMNEEEKSLCLFRKDVSISIVRVL